MYESWSRGHEDPRQKAQAAQWSVARISNDHHAYIVAYACNSNAQKAYSNCSHPTLIHCRGRISSALTSASTTRVQSCAWWDRSTELSWLRVGTSGKAQIVNPFGLNHGVHHMGMQIQWCDVSDSLTGHSTTYRRKDQRGTLGRGSQQSLASASLSSWHPFSAPTIAPVSITIAWLSDMRAAHLRTSSVVAIVFLPLCSGLANTVR